MRTKQQALPLATVFQEAERRLDIDPSATYRQLRDAWLKADFNPPQSAVLKSPWKEFCLSSLAWGGHRDLQALQLLHRASLVSERYFWMRYYIAEILLRRLDLYDLARKEMGAVVQKCPWLWEARCLWAEILIAFGIKDPLKVVRELHVPEKAYASSLAWRGALKLWSGEGKGALQDLDVAVSLDNPDALCWRGGTRILLGHPKEALEDLNRVLRIDAQDPEALVWRGEANRLLGRLPESLVDLDAVIAQQGAKPWAYVNRALIHIQREDREAACQDFSRLYADNDCNWYKSIKLTSSQMENLLLKALKSARGCRRSEPHLNIGWMKAAGIPTPMRATPDTCLLHWMRAMNVPTPPHPQSRPNSVSEEDARRALNR